MKKLLPFILAVFAVSKLDAQAIPNGSFQNWNLNTWSDPQSYTTSNDQDVSQVPGFTANVTQLPPWEQGQGFAVQLQTVALNGDTFPAFITNSINNPLAGKGGVLYSGQPTGIEVWYNYTSSTVAADTGGMIVVFKNSAGSVIGTYLIPLTTATGYPLAQFTFSPALPSAADTVIFAATSSINVLNGKNGFAGSTLALSEVEFTYSSSGTAQPADLNWDFDPWVGDTAFAPQGWTGTFPGTRRSTDTYNGYTYALELTTLSNANNNKGDSTNPAVSTTGRLTNNGIAGGYPYTQTADTLKFYYVYTPAGTNTKDSGNVTLEFKSGSNFNYTGRNLGAAASYTLAELPFNLVSFTPDSVIATFFSSSSRDGNVPLTDVGSTLLVDNVQFASQATGIKPVLLANNTILIYPNPASTQLTIASAQTNINEVRVLNILGQTILDKQYAIGIAAEHETIDVSTLPAGMYFISVTANGNTSTGKITVSNK